MASITKRLDRAACLSQELARRSRGRPLTDAELAELMAAVVARGGPKAERLLEILDKAKRRRIVALSQNQW